MHNFHSMYTLHAGKQFRIIFMLLSLGYALTFCGYNVYASEWSFSADFPEGFTLTASDNNSCSIYSGTQAPVDVLLKVYSDCKAATAKDAFTLFSQHINATTGAVTEFEWCGTTAALAEVTFPIPESNGARYVGIGLVFRIPDSDSSYLAAVSYAEECWIAEFIPEIQSAIDSINPSADTLLSPGALTTMKYPSKKVKEYSIKISDKKAISIPLFENDISANDSVVTREFKVLAQYADSPLKKDAWERCYRMIYRDAFSRLEKASFLISNEFRYSGDKPLQNTELAAAVLSWLQNFTYESKPGFDNFLNLPAALTEQRGDCDTRGVLMAVIMKQSNIDTVLLLSEKARHAIPAVDVPGKGARFTANGKKYLLAETTAHVSIGLIDSALSNIALWSAFSFSN